MATELFESVVGDMSLREADYYENRVVFGSKGRRVRLNTEDWEALGRPQSVTVTVSRATAEAAS